MTPNTQGRGVFITLEGPEGAGKTTQARRLVEWLEGRGVPVLATREPGGTPIGERIRQVLLDSAHREMAPETEMLLFAAARAQLVRQVIRPALERGLVVISERYVEASLAYQGAGRGIDLDVVRDVNRIATDALRPDLTVLLDIDPEQGLERVGGGHDRMEQESLAFHTRVREGFLNLARESPSQFLVVDTSHASDEVHRTIVDAVEALLAGRLRRSRGGSPSNSCWQ